LAEERMVVHRENPDRARINAHHFPTFLRNSLNLGPLRDVP
jgi:hypothetical protein